jgi:hypothetical protein
MMLSGSPGARTRTTFLDVSERVYTVFECGFLCAVFHPDFAVNGQVFVSCVEEDDQTCSLLTRFTLRVSKRSPRVPSSSVVAYPNDHLSRGMSAFDVVERLDRLGKGVDALDDRPQRTLRDAAFEALQAGA